MREDESMVDVALPAASGIGNGLGTGFYVGRGRGFGNMSQMASSLPEVGANHGNNWGGSSSAQAKTDSDWNNSPDVNSKSNSGCNDSGLNKNQSTSVNNNTWNSNSNNKDSSRFNDSRPRSDPEIVGTLDQCTSNSWIVPDFPVLAQRGTRLSSRSFEFRSVLWQLHISPNISEVSLSLESASGSGSRTPFPFSWEISVENIWDDVLKRIGGVCQGEELLQVALSLGPLSDVQRFVEAEGTLRVQCDLWLPDDITDPPSRVETESGDPEIAGTLQSYVQCKHSWIVPEFPVLAQRGRCLSSKSFGFGSRLWQLHISPKISEISLSLERASGSGADFPISWELSVENDWGDVLKRIDGVCQGAEEPLGVNLSLGLLSDVQRFFESDGALRVQCKLRLPDQITDPPSRFEKEAGTDILVRDFQRLLTSGESSDATVRVKAERDFRVHRSVLVARTPIFASMFRHQMSETVTGIVNVEDCEPDTFEQFLQHVYTGRVEDLCPENAVELYQVADKYQVDDLKSKCLECVKGGISVKTFCPTLKLALRHSEAELTQFATEFFAKNMKDIIVTVEWQQFIIENPIGGNELYVKVLGAA